MPFARLILISKQEIERRAELIELAISCIREDKDEEFIVEESIMIDEQDARLMVINGELSEDDLFEKSLYATRQLAKRQCTWIRGWENLHTYDIDEFDQATKQLKKQLNFA